MRRQSPLGLAVIGLAVLAPGSARAFQDPGSSGYTPPSPAYTYPNAPAASPAPAPAPIDHKHYGRVKMGLAPCEKCEAAKKAGRMYQVSQAAPSAPGQVQPGHEHVQAMAGPMGMPPGSQIVGCVHSQNGVCKACRKYLEMPGAVTMAVPGTPPAVLASASSGAAGHAVASDGAPGRAVVETEPEPLSVLKTNYNQNGPAAGMQAPGVATTGTMPPAVGSSPYAPQSDQHDPHVLGHLFGFSAMQRDFHDMWTSRSKKKRDAHAAVSYDAPAERPTTVPASSVYGPGGGPR